MKELPYWLALNAVSVLGSRRIRKLIDFTGSAREAFSLPEEEILKAGIPEKAAAAFIRERAGIDPEHELLRCQELGINVVTLADSNYPELLMEIYDPPAVLYFRGELEELKGAAVAVVGSRKATAYGRNAAIKISRDLAAAGVAVISGMARGIDTCAHLGALEGGGRTYAVLGCGLDICYPPENKKLMARIERHGAVISEFPPGTRPRPAHFPMRNRIISGLSQAVLIVEAAEKSGALITADCALEQGRDVFAVPGSINSLTSRGCHRLLREGAGIAEGAEDILSALGLAGAVCSKPLPELTEEQQKILRNMEYEPLHIDRLAEACCMPAAELLAILVEMEINGLVKKLPGNYFLRV